jgi:hypothetical protein
MHGMSPSEQMDVFSMADINRDGHMAKTEWAAFHKFFVAPYQECADNEYMTS